MYTLNSYRITFAVVLLDKNDKSINIIVNA